MKKRLVLIAFVLCVPVLWAADGVIEINQAAVEANGGFPYVINEPGSYLLTGNLTVPDENTTAIEVRAADVTLDLNGFAIIGPVQCTAEDGIVSCSPEGTGVGVRAQPGVLSATVVRNGTVRGMTRGISVSSGRVEGVRALENGVGGGIAVSTGIVRGCLAESNGGFGISISSGTVEHSIALFNRTGIRVREGVARGNASDSIFAQDSTVLGNWIGTELEIDDSSGYADNVIAGGLEGDVEETRPIGCNLIVGNLICPEGSAAQGASGP